MDITDYREALKAIQSEYNGDNIDAFSENITKVADGLKYLEGHDWVPREEYDKLKGAYKQRFGDYLEAYFGPQPSESNKEGVQAEELKDPEPVEELKDVDVEEEVKEDINFDNVFDESEEDSEKEEDE